jgi:hypothetical protein
MLNTTAPTKSSARRHKPGIYGVQPGTQPPIAQRTSSMPRKANKPAPKTEASYGYDVDLPEPLTPLQHLHIPRLTDELEPEEEIAIRHTERLPSCDQREQRRRRRDQHPLIWIGGTLALLTLGWLATTSGAAWYETTFRDPGTYGPMHGNMALGVFGKGDSADTPSKLIAMNNDGHIQVIKLTGNDPDKASIIIGPDLRAIGFPNPTSAEVQIEVGNVDQDHHADLIITMYANVYDLPLHRYRAQYVLYGDGKGGLKPRVP